MLKNWQFFIVSLLLLTTACTPTLNTHLGEAQKARNATIPHHLASHQDKLLEALKGTGAQVFHEDDRLRITFPKTANFKPNSSAVNEQMQVILRLIAKVIQKYPYAIAEIEGYTDDQGNLKVNQALSERRSHAVIAYLESQGIPGNRLATAGHSEANPRANNSSHHGRAINRRIEIIIFQHIGRYRTLKTLKYAS